MSGNTIVAPLASLPEHMSIMDMACQHCGHDIPTADQANLRIKDLEAQVRLLNTKAAAAVDRLADYEDEVRSLRDSYSQLQQQHVQQQQQQQQQTQTSPSRRTMSVQHPPQLAPSPSIEQPSQTITPSGTPPVPITTTTTSTNPSSPPRTTSRLASLSSFLPGRKRDLSLPTPQPSTPTFGFFPQQLQSQSQSPHPSEPPNQPPTLSALQATLENERTLRLRAESTLDQTQVEIEELTATLFGQANEMVATERKARAKLEERVKVLEDRDGEKRRRLERLEGALQRIERVRGLVGGASATLNSGLGVGVGGGDGGTRESRQRESVGGLRVINADVPVRIQVTA